MDHHEQHHQHHEKERQEEIKHRKQHERQRERTPRSIHPGWYLVIAVVATLAAMLVWMSMK